MKTVGIFEAKTTLSRLIEQVEKGEVVTITRNGKPVARLTGTPAAPTTEEIERRKAAVARLNVIASRLKINATQEEIKSWINEGRH
jgi:prevent-host-death family protein